MCIYVYEGRLHSILCMREPGQDQSVAAQCEVRSGSSENPAFDQHC